MTPIAGATASKAIARWAAGDPCPAETCDACPASGCICPPCGCANCRRRARIARSSKTTLRSRAATPVRERLFDPEPDPIRAAGRRREESRA